MSLHVCLWVCFCLLVQQLAMCTGQDDEWWLVPSYGSIFAQLHTHTHTHTRCQVNRKRFDWIREERLSKRIEDRETETEMDKEKKWGQKERTHWQNKLLWDKLFNAGGLHYYTVVKYEFVTTFKSVKHVRPTSLLATVVSYGALLSKSISLSSLVSNTVLKVYTPASVANYI